MTLSRRLLSLAMHPRAEWRRIRDEDSSVDALLRSVIIPMAVPAPVATYIGMKHFDAAWDIDHGYQVAAGDVFATASLTFFASIASIFLLAAIFCIIGPMYRVRPTYLSGLKVASYGATPLLLSGAALVMPDLVVVAMVALCHTLYLYYVGVGTVLGIESDREEFICIAAVMLGLASMLAGALIASIGML